MKMFIHRLGELGKDADTRVGKKCANLGELTRAGFRVPRGFALGLSAYERFMNETGALTEIKGCLLDFNPDPHSPSSTDIYKEKSRELRAIVEEKEMPRELEETIQTYYRELSPLQSNHSAPVAVRSAGAVSHPGQYETYLQVVGASDLSEKVKRVWSSTFNTRSLIARHRSGFPRCDYPE